MVGTLILILAVSWYWQEVETFEGALFGIGTIAAVLDCFGKACMIYAFSVGPAGVIGAFVTISNVLLIIVEAFREWRVPFGLEITSFLLATFGAMWFVIPNEMIYGLRLIFCCKRIGSRAGSRDSPTFSSSTHLPN